MKFITALKRLFPSKVIEKGFSGEAPTTASSVITVEGEFYLRFVYAHNTGTTNATISIYSGDPGAGGVKIMSIPVTAGTTVKIDNIKGVIANTDVYIVSDQAGVFVVLGGEDYLAK